MAQERSYSNGFHHAATDSNAPLSVRTSSMNEESLEDSSNLEMEVSSALDHALLESLFYNEMMMLNPSSPGSSTFLSQHFNEATQPSRQQNPPAPVGTGDPNTIAEKDLLRDFGVSASPIRPSTHRLDPPGEAPTSANAVAHSWSDPLAVPAPSHAHAPKHVPIYPAPLPLTAYPFPETASTQYSSFAASKPSSLERPPLSIDTSVTTPTVSNDRAKQLVDQFATLASRLGIELPNNVLQSLTAAAAKNDPQLASSSSSKPASSSPLSTPPLTSSNSMIPSKPAGARQQPDSSISSVPTLADAEDPTQTGPAALQELRKTAEEAIASVTQKRALDMDGADSIGEGSNSGNPKDSKLHSTKRKKKPRLQDCESRLAELRAENELLKRHLENVSNKAYRFDKEKEAAGKRIHGLLEDNAVPEEMNRAVQEFTEMYSDYGRNRQQELSFHLEQLQRLVNPTNFTKMGLWTLGQNSISPKHNPIAGILQKELDITPQQGRKILDQSEKIRDLCGNLKECLALLAKLNSLCQQKTQLFQNRMDKCREILTTKQVVALIKWIDDHTELLETVCPGWGTEHIHKSNSKHS